MTVFFFVLAGAFAFIDWFAVERDRRALEYLFKPAVIAALILAAITLDPADDLQRGLFVVALVLSLAGDVFLMLPSDCFVAGLAAFLLAHTAYIAGFVTEGPSLGPTAISTVAVATLSVPLGAWILRSVRASSPRLALPVAAYMFVISTMAIAALATGDVRAGAGALLFYSSDALIAVGRFVVALPWARTAVMVTYHIAQGALVASLLS
jgi:uncharacterized membrane protein YhhN